MVRPISLKGHGYYLWVIALGLLLRVLWAIAVPVIPVSDSHAYDTFALNLTTGQGYGWVKGSPTAFWPPGTSFVYAAFYWLLGHRYLPIIALNLVLSAVIIGLSMYLAETWFSRRIAAATGLLLALWPSQIQFTTVLASELLFTALVLAILAVWGREDTNLWVRTVVIGILLASASYVRPTVFLFPILLFFFRWVNTKERFKTLTAIGVMFVLMALLIAPWSIRNMRVFGQFVPISTNGGATLWMGNSPNSTGGYRDLPPETIQMNEASREKFLKSIAIAHIKENPLLFVSRSVKRLIDTHSRESIGIAWNEAGLVKRYGNRILLPLKLINQFYWMSVLGLALVGIILLGQQRGWLNALTHPTVVTWAYFATIHAIVIAQDRYHFPSNPMIGMLAAITLVYLLDRKQKSNDRLADSLSTPTVPKS